VNVCFLTSTFHPQVGGAETYALTIATGLARRGHGVLVVTERRPDARSGPAERAGAEVLRLDSERALRGQRSRVLWEQMAFGLLGELAEPLRGRRIDLLHANDHGMALLGAMLSLDLGVPLVATFHDQAPEDGPYGVGRSRLVYERLGINLVLAPSRFYRDKAIRFGAAPDRVRLVYLGIDAGQFRAGDRLAARERLGLAPETELVVCAATLKERKGLRHLVAAAALLRAAHPCLRVVIAGRADLLAGDYADGVRADIGRLGLRDMVVIDEDRTHDEMPALFGAADVVVQPSLAEGLGLALLEGMASGAVAVGSDITGISEIVSDGIDGLLVPPADPAALAATLDRALTDGPLRERLRAAGERTVRERFTVDRQLEETVGCYKEAIATRSAAGP
jgi:glycosyltransferase involved in cell wall biosynthesis